MANESKERRAGRLSMGMACRRIFVHVAGDRLFNTYRGNMHVAMGCSESFCLIIGIAAGEG